MKSSFGINEKFSYYFIKLKGCFFHLVQSIRKMEQQLGLTKKKNQLLEADLRIKVRCLSALAFVPEDDVAAGFILIKKRLDKKKDPEGLFQLYSYFQKNYIGKPLTDCPLDPSLTVCPLHPS